MFNKVPVMAMLRVPTEESKGKSNLHQGAIGLGWIWNWDYYSCSTS